VAPGGLVPVDGARTKAGRRECGVCWNVYDPAVGDPQWQVPPGTAFEDLPAHWSCPNCAAEQSKFLELPDE
jgi:rubredoxin